MPQYAETECKFNIGKISLKKKGMKKMKKLLAWILSMSMILTSCGLTALAVEVSDSVITYSQTFDDAASIDDFTKISQSNSPNKSYNAADGKLSFSANGNTGLYLLPETVTAANFVMEADITVKDNNNSKIGFIFNYNEDENANASYAGITYYTYAGHLVLTAVENGVGNTRWADGGKGTSVITANGETAKLKMIVNNGKFEFFVNGELSYTITSRESSSVTWLPDFTKGGRLGMTFQTGAIDVDNVTGRTVD